jgi:hypothetical protein
MMFIVATALIDGDVVHWPISRVTNRGAEGAASWQPLGASNRISRMHGTAPSVLRNWFNQVGAKIPRVLKIIRDHMIFTASVIQRAHLKGIIQKARRWHLGVYTPIGFFTLLGVYTLLGFYTLVGFYTPIGFYTLVGFYTPLGFYALAGFFTLIGFCTLLTISPLE